MRLAGVIAVLATAACAPRATPTSSCSPPPASASDGHSLLADPLLALPAWDSGQIVHACRAEAPWGNASWGVEAASFLDEDAEASADRTIDLARVSVQNGAARIAAADVNGRWAFARVIQGDVWGGTSCGPVPWNRIEPILVARQRLTLDFDACLESSALRSAVGSWILAGANVWLSGPTLPARGEDRNGRKPLVLDLMVHHRSSMIGTSDGSHESAVAYHYQTSVAEAPPGRWTHVALDLTREVRAAAARFGLERSWNELAIGQVELVVEVHDAAATLWFSGPRLRRL